MDPPFGVRKGDMCIVIYVYFLYINISRFSRFSRFSRGLPSGGPTLIRKKPVIVCAWMMPKDAKFDSNAAYDNLRKIADANHLQGVLSLILVLFKNLTSICIVVIKDKK